MKHPTRAAARRAGDPLAGTGYRSIRRLGAGSYGVVVEAEQIALRRAVVVKILHETHARRPAAVDRLRLEAQAVAAIAERTPHVVSVLDLGRTADGRPFLVLERLVGRTLQEELDLRGALPVDEAVAIASQMLDGLTATHEAGIVHRDLKPENVFLAETFGGARIVKLIDFGLARLTAPGETTSGTGPMPLANPTEEGVIVGTPRFFAPEQARGEPATLTSDLYSTGVVLYAMLTGRDLFPQYTNVFHLVRAHVTEAPLLPSRQTSRVIPAALEDVVMRSLSKRQDDRFADARAFGEALAQATAAEPRAATLFRSVVPTMISAGSLAAPVQPGDVLRGKYRVERLLGAGGMAYVVAAMHIDLEQRVAIKLLRPETATDPDIVERFLREARAASRIESPYVARVIDVDRLESGPPFIVMEHLEGADLEQILRTRGARSPLPIQDVVGWLTEACEGVAAAHAQGIVHRDLKPANLFLTDKRGGGTVVKVLDFGISKLLQDTRLTRADVGMGSAEYVSPEQLRSAADVDGRSDIWSLGVTLYELLTGVSPFRAEGVAEVATAVLMKDPAPPRSVRPDLPPGLDALVVRCMSKDPAGRPSSVVELVRALAPFRVTSSAGASYPTTTAIAAVAGPVGHAHDASVSSVSFGLHSPKVKLIAAAATCVLGLVVIIAAFTMGRSRDAGPAVVRGRYELSASALRDTQTRLAWQRQPAPGAMDWASAKAYCSGLGGGYRLPSLSELTGLLPVTDVDPPLDPASFPTTAVDVFWSSSQPSAGIAAVVHFSTGRQGTSVTSGRNRTRCVR